jgi:hypothetical protein
MGYGSCPRLTASELGSNTTPTNCHSNRHNRHSNRHSCNFNRSNRYSNCHDRFSNRYNLFNGREEHLEREVVEKCGT